MSIKMFRIMGLQIRLREAGTGPCVVLLHGFGEDGTIWEGVLEKLSESYRVLVPDLPGSGDSEMFSNEGDATPGLEKHAAIIHALLEELHISTCTLIGHSMGGYIALAFAEKYSSRLNGLGLFHSTAFADSEERKQIRKKGIEFVREYGAGTFLAQAIPNLFTEKFKATYPEVIRYWVDRATGFNKEVIISYYRAMVERPDRSELLKELPYPILFVMGEEDKTLILTDILTQTHLPAVASVHILPGVAHMGMLEEKIRTNKILMEFLHFING